MLWVGVLGATCSTTASVPQLWKTFKYDAVDDLHPFTMCIRLVGCVMWCVYGVQRDEWILAVSSAVAGLVEALLLAKYLKLYPTNLTQSDEDRAPTMYTALFTYRRRCLATSFRAVNRSHSGA